MIADDQVDALTFAEWRAATRSFLHKVFGDSHPHVTRFDKHVHRSDFSDTQEGFGILLAASEELREGFVGRLQELLAAEIFSDFLDMAKHLVEAGYKDAAASLAGAVLEDGLRRIAEKHSITVKNRDDLGSLNQRLADATVYNRLTQKRVHVWNDLRNQADHGKFHEYSADDVLDFVAGVERFMEEHL